MALVLADRVQETTNTTGTGTLTLAGAVAGFQSFGVIGNANTTYYAIKSGVNWEVGIGTYTTSGTTLSRTTILASSSGGTAITVAAGASVFCTYPATQAVYENAAGNVDGFLITGGSINNTPIGATTANTVAATTLSASSTVSGTGFSTYLASPPAIGGTAAAAITGTTVTATTGFAGPLNGTVGATTPASVVATTVAATASTSGSAATGAISYGTLSYSDANNLLTLQSSVNAYNQLVIQNTNAGSAASADLTISNDQGSSSTFYGNFGINSSGWAGTLGSASLSSPNVVYLTGTSGDMVLGTTTSNSIRFVVAGGADAVTIDTNSRMGIGVTSPTAALHLEAGIATANFSPLKFTTGTNLTTPEAGSVEYDGVTFYQTPNTTSGRGYTPAFHIFRLAANVTAFGPAIGNFFGANSAINLVGGGIYEIEAHCYFTKTTAGTVVVTATTSLAPVNLSGAIQTGAVTGGTATGVAQQIALYNSTSAAAAFGATGSLTTAVNHYMKISLLVEANASASNLRINFTSSAGTVTPLRTSYYKVTRLPAGNSGSFAA